MATIEEQLDNLRQEVERLLSISRLPYRPPGVVFMDEGTAGDDTGIIGRKRRADFRGAGVVVTDGDDRAIITIDGAGTFCYDYLVSSCWNGTEGQEFPGLTGCTFKVYSTFQAALDDGISVGDAFSMFVCPGRYSEIVTINDSGFTNEITIHAAGRDVVDVGKTGGGFIVGNHTLDLRDFTIRSLSGQRCLQQAPSSVNMEISAHTMTFRDIVAGDHAASEFYDCFFVKGFIFETAAQSPSGVADTPQGVRIYGGSTGANTSIDFTNVLTAAGWKVYGLDLDGTLKLKDVDSSYFNIRFTRNGPQVTIDGICEGVQLDCSYRQPSSGGSVVEILSGGELRSGAIRGSFEMVAGLSSATRYIKATGIGRAVHVDISANTASGNYLEDDGAISVSGDWRNSKFTLVPAEIAQVNTTGSSTGNTIDSGAITSGSVGIDRGDHGELGGLADDDHSSYLWLPGRSGGQVAIGGIADFEELILRAAPFTSPIDSAVVHVELDERLGAGHSLIVTDRLWSHEALNILYSTNAVPTPDVLETIISMSARGIGVDVPPPNVTPNLIFRIIVENLGNVASDNVNAEVELLTRTDLAATKSVTYRVIARDTVGGASRVLSQIGTAGQLALPITGPSAGLLLGADALLYRSAADTLRTPDALIVDGGIQADNIRLPIVGSPTYDDLEDLNTVFHSSGWVNGGTISDAGGATINVAAGAGMIRATDSPTAQLLFFDWAVSNGLAITANSIRYIGVEYNAGSPQVVVRTSDNFDHNTDFPLGTVVNEAGTLHIQNAPWEVGDHARAMIERVRGTVPIARDREVGGIIFSETGTRNVAVTAGQLWRGLTAFVISAIDTDPGGAADTFDTYSAGGQEATGVAAWPNEQYDNAGTLTTMTNNRWANLWWYIELDGELVMVYGTAQYTTQAQAENEAAPSILPNRLQVHGVLAARFIFQKSAATAAEILSAFDLTFSVVGVTDHGNLAGLGDDDHTQYALLAGRSGGQSLVGSPSDDENLTLRANSGGTGQTGILSTEDAAYHDEFLGLNLRDFQTRTIASGLITCEQSTHRLQAQSGTSDNLAGVTTRGPTGADATRQQRNGRILILRPISGHTITVKHNDTSEGTAGDRIFLNGASDVVLDSDDLLFLVYDQEADSASGAWLEINRTNSPAAPATIDTSNAEGTSQNLPRLDHQHAHGSGYLTDAHHAQAHTIASHSDTTATGPETETLTDGSDADALHDHTNHGVTHNAVHGISKHTEFNTWKVFYTDGSGDQQETAVGTDGQVYKGTSATGAPAFEDDEAGIEFMIDGGGVAITTGIKGWLAAPFACTIKAVRLLADQNGAIKVDIWKDTYANYPPTDADSITASAVPEIAASGKKDEDTTLTGWTISVAKGDILYYNVDSVTTIERCLVVLEVDKS